jgi:hypothetical protein
MHQYAHLAGLHWSKSLFSASQRDVCALVKISRALQMRCCKALAGCSALLGNLKGMHSGLLCVVSARLLHAVTVLNMLKTSHALRCMLNVCSEITKLADRHTVLQLLPLGW